MGLADDLMRELGIDECGRPVAENRASGTPPDKTDVFALANSVDPLLVADWLGIERDGRHVLRCPGCGADRGVDILDRGIKCQHDSCRDKGRNGFRSNVDLAMEVRGVSAIEAAKWICAQVALEVPDPPRRTVLRTTNASVDPTEEAEEETDPHTDLANAERLVAEDGDDLRYCAALGGWLVWDGRRFRCDETGEAHRRAKNMLRRHLATAAMMVRDAEILVELAEKSADPLKIEAAKKKLRAAKREYGWFARSQNASRITFVLTVASTEPSVALASGAFDVDPWLFNVRNGTIDLRSCKLLPHNRNKLITKVAPVTHDPMARAPKWQQFLTVVLPDEEVRAFVQRLIGYSLVGEVYEHIFAILHGGGANGKSVFVETVAYVAGDYAKSVPASVFMAQRSEQHPTGLATLRGLRVAIAAESDQGAYLAESTIKQLTGGDTITARHLYREFFEFKPSHTFLFSTNHRPRIRGTDNGIWRRIALVPFVATIPKDEQDPHLTRKLRKEASGILNWMLDGLKQWQREGLKPPDAVRRSTEEYRDNEDTLADFIDERCACEQGASVGATRLYKEYCQWAERAGSRAMSQRAFGEAMTERGFERRKTGGTKQYVGVRIATYLNNEEST